MALNRLCGVSILFGIPIEQEKFMVRVQKSDWLAKYHIENESKGASKNRLSAIWYDKYFRHVAKPFTELSNAALQCGVNVIRNAILDDLYGATKNSHTVILVSHWKGAEFSNNDFITGISEKDFIGALNGDESSLGKWLIKRFADAGLTKNVNRESFVGRVKRSFSTIQAVSVKSVMREALTARLPDELILEAGVDSIYEHEAVSAANRRDRLDELFRDFITPGNRMEFFDGMHDKYALSQSIHPDFTGVLDLTTCVSTIAADYVGASRNHLFRTVQFSVALEPVFAAECLKRTLLIMAKEETNYLDARHSAYCQLVAQLREYKKSLTQ